LTPTGFNFSEYTVSPTNKHGVLIPIKLDKRSRRHYDRRCSDHRGIAVLVRRLEYFSVDRKAVAVHHGQILAAAKGSSRQRERRSAPRSTGSRFKRRTRSAVRAVTVYGEAGYVYNAHLSAYGTFGR
jgi:hypothetical protein